VRVDRLPSGLRWTVPEQELRAVNPNILEYILEGYFIVYVLGYFRVYFLVYNLFLVYVLGYSLVYLLGYTLVHPLGYLLGYISVYVLGYILGYITLVYFLGHVLEYILVYVLGYIRPEPRTPDPAKLVRGGGLQDGFEALSKALAAPRPSNDGLARAMADSARSSADAMKAAAREEAEGSVKAAQILTGDGLWVLSSILGFFLVYFLGYIQILTSSSSSLLPSCADLVQLSIQEFILGHLPYP